MNFKNILYILSLVLLVLSCSYFAQENPEQAIARVGEKYLYREDIASIMPQDYTKEDSINITQKFINSWAVKELMLTNAERNINEEDKENFEKLVNDYRADLYINAYKESLINRAIDTIIPKEEIDFFYQKNKQIFKLNEDLVKLRYIQLSPMEKPKKISQLEEKLKRFTPAQRRELDSISLQFNSAYLNDTIWVKAESVLKKLPFLENKISEKRENFINHKDSTGIYLVQITNVIRKNEEAPIEYAFPTLKQIILNQRKLEFIKKLESDIINTGIKKNQFEIIYE